MWRKSTVGFDTSPFKAASSAFSVSFTNTVSKHCTLGQFSGSASTSRLGTPAQVPLQPD